MKKKMLYLELFKKLLESLLVFVSQIYEVVSAITKEQKFNGDEISCNLIFSAFRFVSFRFLRLAIISF